MKNLIFSLLSILTIGAVYYLLSPLWNVIETDDELIFEDTHTDEIILDDEEDQITEDDLEILPPVEMDEPMPVEIMVEENSEPAIVASGKFLPDAHDVAGLATVYESGDERILRFKDFDTLNGPNLHIYLATDTEATDYIDLGEIRATKGNVNYEIENAIDLSVYDHVLVWCVPFGVNFSYAVLD